MAENSGMSAGPDPMGIGVYDLGRSSYDPLDTIRRGWANMRQDRIMGEERRLRQYESYMNRIPDYQTVNANTTGMLNKDLVRLGELAATKAETGPFFEWQKNEEGQKLEAEMADIENRMGSYGPVLAEADKRYSDIYKLMQDPANFDQLDMELTTQNLEALAGAQSYEEVAQVLPQLQAVWKPKPEDIMGYMKQIGSMIEGEDVLVHDAKIDPINQTLTVEQVTGADPKQVHQSYQVGYEMAEPNMKNAIDRLYNNAPDKFTEDGIEMGAKEWFANKASGFHGTTTTKKTTRQAKVNEPTPSGLTGGIPKTPEGEIILEAMMEPMVMKVSTTTPATMKKNIFGKEKEDTPEMTSGEEYEFESFNIPLTGINEVFDTMTPADAIDTSTGAQPDRTKIASNKASSVSFMPTYNGTDPRPVQIEYTDENGVTKTKKITVKPGQPIPMEAQRALIKQGIPMSYEPYLITKSVYGAAQEEKNMGAVSWSDYVSKHGKTVVTPWSSINNSFLAKMGAEEYQIAQLQQEMAQVYEDLNKKY